MARTRSGRGIGFFVVVALIAFALVSGGIALSTGRKCSNKGLEREWQFVPPHWECKSGPFVVNN